MSALEKSHHFLINVPKSVEVPKKIQEILEKFWVIFLLWWQYFSELLRIFFRFLSFFEYYEKLWKIKGKFEKLWEKYYKNSTLVKIFFRITRTFLQIFFIFWEILRFKIIRKKLRRRGKNTTKFQNRLQKEIH